MNDVTSLEVSKELYGLSGWDSSTITYQYAIRDDHAAIPNLVPKQPGRSWPEGYWTSWPAYSLGYLLRKLPNLIPGESEHSMYTSLTLNTDGGMWRAYYEEGIEGGVDQMLHFNRADTPEDAAAKLAIELIKQDILKEKENN